MCRRLSQYRGIHDFVAVLSMPNALVNNTSDQFLVAGVCDSDDSLSMRGLKRSCEDR